jgi:AcrR family transcriptional regulator
MGGGWRYPTPVQPSPLARQQRANDTIRAAIDATVELLERLPEHQVTLEAIRERSGVSQGSLSHHFANREGLIATAQVERYARSCAADEEFFSRLAAPNDATTFAFAMLANIDDMLTPQRRAVRWLRMSAISSAFGDEKLVATLATRYTALIDQLSRYVRAGHEHDIVLADSDPRSLALLVSMLAQGLVLDDLMDHEVPPAAWNHLIVCVVKSFLTPATVLEFERIENERYGDLWRAEVFGPPGRVPAEVAERLATVRERADLPAASITDHRTVRVLLESAEQGTVSPRGPRISSSAAAARERLVRAAIAVLRQRGASGIDLAELRTTAGLSPQTFHRLVGTKEGLVREARLELEISRSARSVARFASIVATSRTAEEMRAGIVNDALWMADDASRTSMRQRIETLSATRTDPELRTSLARVQRATRDLLIEQVCLAQSRGLMDPELPSRGVARFLDGTVFWHVFLDLDTHAPARADWTAILGRIAAKLCPGPATTGTPTRVA